MKDLSILIPENEWGRSEECGIFGISSADEKELAREVYFGLFSLQHRGQESAGIAVSYNSNKVAYYKNLGLVSEVFHEEELKLLPNTKVAIGHVRYGFKGSSNVINAQPIVVYGRYGRLALTLNGSIVNADKIRKRMIESGHTFQSSSDAEVVAALISKCATESVEQGIFDACQQLEGAFAFLVLCGDKMIAVRDKYGLKPMVMGTKRGDILFSSESCGLDAIEADTLRDVEPAEMITVLPGGNVVSRKFAVPNMKPCIFELVYLARSDSFLDNVSVYEARHKCGEILADLFKIDADIVSGVPDSAVVTGRGYSVASGIPYVDALSKNRYVGRTFIQPTQSERESSVKIKLNAFRANVRGKRLILIDDSIVRGTTSKKIISLLRASGAKEVHMLVASPIVKYPCYFGVDMGTKEGLIGGYRNEEQIRQIIGADTLRFIPLDLLKKACDGLDYCTGCFDGNYAIDPKKFLNGDNKLNEIDD